MASILGTKKDYTRYYGDFRGVDFSSDHTQVHAQRLAYLVNMYKDYRSGQGYAIETIPGFRRRFDMSQDNESVYGIHEIKFKDEERPRLLVHIGGKLYLWEDYQKSVNVEHEASFVLPEHSKTEDGLNSFTINFDDLTISSIKKIEHDGDKITDSLYTLNTEDKTLTVKGSNLKKDDLIYITYLEQEGATSLFNDMKLAKSTSFIMNNKLYIIDGEHYLVYNGENVKNVTENAYVPTTYVNIIAAGENADAGKQKEQRNLLSPFFKNTFIPDGINGVFTLNEKALDTDEVEVRVYGELKEKDMHYTVNKDEGVITFTEGHIPPINPKFIEIVEGEDNEINVSSAEGDIENAKNYPRDHAGVEITAKKERTENMTAAWVTKCTLATIFDRRVFFSGNPDISNHVIWSAGDDPTYIPEVNYDLAGVGTAPVTGMLAVADTLMVLKHDTQQDGSVYFYKGTATGDDLNPKLYSNTRGLAGIGCLGACINFLDDPVFVSRLGVEAVGQLSTRLERAIEHRSSLIDAKLLNLGADKLASASITEWNGYLILLVDGKIFMADSRQRYTHDIGVSQYEWYYLEDIGVWDGQYVEYRYYSFETDLTTKSVNGYKLALAPEELRGTVVNPPEEDPVRIKAVKFGKVDGVDVCYTVGDEESKTAYICYNLGNMTGGTFRPATVVKTIGDNLFFGTENGVICSFNFDKHNEYGEIPVQYYSFDGRTIFSGCATKMDNCEIPHLTKSTVKKSTVIKTRSMQLSAAKVKVRTNNKPYEQIGRINSTVFSFEDMDFDDFSFITLDQSLFAIKEKEKKWVEKQYYIYSDEFMRPFSLYYVTYRYSVVGRYKE